MIASVQSKIQYAFNGSRNRRAIYINVPGERKSIIPPRWGCLLAFKFTMVIINYRMWSMLRYNLICIGKIKLRNIMPQPYRISVEHNIKGRHKH